MLLSKKLYKCGGWIEVDTFCHIHGETEGFVSRSRFSRSPPKTNENRRAKDWELSSHHWSNSIEIVERTVSQIFSYPGHSLHSVIEWRKNGTSRYIIKSIKSQAVFLVKIWSMKLIFFKIDFWQVKKCIDSGRFDLNFFFLGITIFLYSYTCLFCFDL